jgi:hypothetical protein
MQTNTDPTDDSRIDRSSERSRDSSIPDQAAPLEQYLDDRLREEEVFYDKSRFIAEEVDLSPKEIGAYMRRLREEAPHFQIEKWGYTNGTTWRVSRP